MRHHNVPNDLTLGPSAGGVQNKRQIGRSRSLASLQSAQSAAGAPRRVRGEEQSRPSPSLLRCSRCVARVPRIEADVQQRPAALRHTGSKDWWLSGCLYADSSSVNLGMQCTCMAGRS